jgi:hypothetical protein
MTVLPSLASAGTPEVCLRPAFQKARLSRAEASQYLLEIHGIRAAPPTLAKWACISSDGPKFDVLGRTVLYPRAELDAWVERRMQVGLRSTSDRRAAR